MGIERLKYHLSLLGSNFPRWRGHHCLTMCCHVNLVWQDKAVISVHGGCKLLAIRGHAQVDLHCISLYTIAMTKPPEFSHVNLSMPLFLSPPLFLFYSFPISFSLLHIQVDHIHSALISENVMLCTWWGTHNTHPSHNHSVKSPSLREDV